MRILLDEMVDHRLEGLFTEGFEISTVAKRGWKGRGNGELLNAAQHEFNVLFSTDKNLPYQQDLPRFDLAVILWMPQQSVTLTSHP